ncbi:uncharacterized protein N7482_009995 [Penicillium canariense]|uniref:Pheromone receptor n=1 Tax=Penicillium canariense TaxID=189055 RepID=A0A9W9LGK2_9EURO|nr:uncharacterized protein N7482_009995 [Penicillium canariense]KAJ5153517.1 hypothetical protein N7482_009995 [Penicillium canariense]
MATFEPYTKTHPERLPDFDPFTQSFNLSYPDGTPFTISVTDVDTFIQYNVRICINYGSQFGASIVLFVILLLLTRREKRASSVFLLNSTALLFNIIRLLLQLMHFTTGFEHFYPYFSLDYLQVNRSAFAMSITGSVFESLVVACIEASLVVQVHVVCATIRRRYRWPLLALSIAVALATIAFRLAWMVENSIAIMELSYMDTIWWLESACNIVITVSVCFFCAVFVTKLGFALRQRRRLGVRDFGPMKIVFVGGCQTLTIPAVFSITQYFVVFPELSSNLLTLVAISLPLSSIWAGANLDHGQHSDTQPLHRRNLWRALAFGVNNTTLNNAASEKQTSTTGMTASTAAKTLCYSNQPLSMMSKQSHDSMDPLAIAVEHDIFIDSIRRKHSIV